MAKKISECNTAQINVRMPVHLLAELTDLCCYRGWSQTESMRRAIQNFVDLQNIQIEAEEKRDPMKVKAKAEAAERARVRQLKADLEEMEGMLE